MSNIYKVRMFRRRDIQFSEKSQNYEDRYKITILQGSRHAPRAVRNSNITAHGACLLCNMFEYFSLYLYKYSYLLKTEWLWFRRSIVVAFIFFFLFLPTTFAQNMQTPMVEQNFLSSGFYGGGLTFINGDVFVRLQLQPEFPIGNFGLGFDLVLLYNPYAEVGEDRFLAEDGEVWYSLSTWIRLIRYFRYGQPYDPLYFRLGEFDYLTIGHGSIMSGYSNHDRRGLHFNIRKPDSKYGVETMFNDFGDPAIFGGRGFYRPFQREENNNLLTRFEVGTTYLTDIDPNSLEEGEEPLNAVGLDIGLPIYERSSFRLDLYNDIAALNPPLKPDDSDLEDDDTETQTDDSTTDGVTSVSELGIGNATGIGFVSNKAIIKLEYRIFSAGYIPSVFDYTYETGTPEFWGYQETDEARHGYYTQLIWQPTPQIHLLGAFERYSNNTSKLYLGIKESGLVPRLAFRAFYTKRNIGEDGVTGFFRDLIDLDEKSALNLEIRYVVVPPVQTIIIKEYRYRRVTTDDGVTQFEPIHKTSIMVGIATDF